jgi:hypothetical protein
MGSESPIVASIFCSMTLLNDLGGFVQWHTPSQHSITADSIEVWLIPQVCPAFLDELLLVYPKRHIACDHKVDNVCILGVGVCDLEECVISKEVVVGIY